MAVIGIIAPPVEQLIKGNRPLIDGPINLWVDIIEPAFLYPFTRIGKQFIIGGAAMGIGALVILIMVCPNTKRTYTKLNPGLMFVNAVTQHFNQQVHVIAPPVFDIIKTVWMLLKGFRIVYILTCYLVRVKVIVEVNTVNIIIVHYIQKYLHKVIAYFGYARVKELNAAINK